MGTENQGTIEGWEDELGSEPELLIQESI